MATTATPSGLPPPASRDLGGRLGGLPATCPTLEGAAPRCPAAYAAGQPRRFYFVGGGRRRRVARARRHPVLGDTKTAGVDRGGVAGQKR